MYSAAYKETHAKDVISAVASLVIDRRMKRMPTCLINLNPIIVILPG
jgi:hypothetical protein